MTGHDPLRRGHPARRPDRTIRHRLRAAGVKRASRRYLERIRIARAELRVGNAEGGIRRQHGPQQRFGIRVTRRIEKTVRVGFFHDAAEVHHRNSRCHVLDGGEVVADQHVGQPELRAQILHQVQDLRLHGHVQGRGRLVANDHFRAVDQGPGDRDPLALPAGELVRMLPQPPLGPRHAHLLEQPHRPGAGFRRARPPVPALRFDELVADRVGRVQRGHRFLEDHTHPVPPDVRHLALRQVEEIPAVEREPPGGALRPCGQQVHERE